MKSAFTADNPEETPDLWLEVRKERKPKPPELRPELKDWVPQKFQNNPDEYVDKDIDELLGLLNQQITVVVEKRTSYLTGAFSEERRLKDHPEVEDAWLDYLENNWKPWSEKTRCWRKVQDVYENVDFMRQRIEEAEERYELLLAIGLLQWIDSTGETIKRHLLTAPAEISLDAARGVLTVKPAVSFEKFRVELDMLEPKDRPRLDGTDLENRLEELDVCAWNKASVAGILRIIANRANINAQVNEDEWKPLGCANNTFQVLYAPALVLRDRRLAAYEDLISRFLESSMNDSTFSTTAPWEHFVREGDTSGCPESEVSKAGDVFGEVVDHLYFPLPTNDEQRKIVECLRSNPSVLVKGPPGTGKSHTIANLICHLLATGERVLVTAHTSKALTVLCDLLPKDIRDLCVIALGFSHEDHRLLEESVQRILSRKNMWKGPEWARGEMDRLERELRQLEDESAEVDRRLREYRKAETLKHSPISGYTGTAAQIARQIGKEKEMYDWFPELADDQKPCPLGPEEISFLAEVHAALTQEQLDDLRCDIGTFSLPDPTEFAASVEKLKGLEDAVNAALAGLNKAQLIPLEGVSDASLLEECKAFLSQLETEVTRATLRLGDLTNEILKDYLVGQNVRWDRLERDIDDLARKIQAARERIGTARIDTPPEIENAKLLSDAQRRLEHLRNDGKRGWDLLAPRVVRETRYIEKHCRVNGQAPRDQQLLGILVGFLELRELLDRLRALWPTDLEEKSGNPNRLADEMGDMAQQFCNLVRVLRDARSGALNVIPIEVRESLSERNGRTTWRRLVEAEIARRHVAQVQASFEEWHRAIRGVASENVHPSMGDLFQAIKDRDLEKWSTAWRTREDLKDKKDRFQRYQKLLDNLGEVHPDLVDRIRSSQGQAEWKKRLSQLEKAWHWASAKAWLRQFTGSQHYEQLVEKRHQLQKSIEKKIEELAALKAWQAFFLRLDAQTEQFLIAWRNAVDRIGQGTGKNAYQHRRTARGYFMKYIPKMPAWIMPFHKLWETTSPEPGVFDTIIVDEASQAGIEALVLFLLAKRIIIVGDDQQNSPEAVGVSEKDIAGLIRTHLKEFIFSEEFRPDTSLYDHAHRAFRNVISLREHFRCVPEIIRFSNDLCYENEPLIPLRQPPPRRLPPLKAEFVKEGRCEGKGSRIHNRAEAEAIVEKIQKCLADKEYKGKTMGVIALQGHTQAQIIEKRLAEEIDPKVREERKLRCGIPPTFQGDERDVIFLSLVVAPNHELVALTKPLYKRRFNVAMSCARDQVWLFHSVKDLSQSDFRWRLLDFFYNPDRRALEKLDEELSRLENEARCRSRELGNQPDPYESWFEVDVALELLRRNYRLRPQVEFAGYYIDLVVEGEDKQLAVECDGDAWHSSDEALERDMKRQRQLERAGWTFVRIRESEFYADRERSIDRIVKKCEELGIRPMGEEDPAENAPAAETSSEENKEGKEESESYDEEVPEETEKDRDSVSSAEGESVFPDLRYASLSDIQVALRRIIEKEGPINKRLLTKLYVSGCPSLHRASKSVKSQLNKALDRMEKAGEIVVVDELGDRSLESQVLRLANAPKVRERPSDQRHLLEIPPSELWTVFERIQASSTRTAKDDKTLARTLLKHYGFRRLTRNTMKYIEKILKRYRSGAAPNI